MFAGIFSCTPSFSPEINKVYLILSYLILSYLRVKRKNKTVSKTVYTLPFRLLQLLSFSVILRL